MKAITILLAVLAITLQASALTNDNRADSRADLNPPYQQPYQPQSLSQDRPTFFTENKGQWDERVLFKAEGAGGLTWFIERDGFTVLFSVADSGEVEQQITQIKQIEPDLKSAESAKSAVPSDFQSAVTSKAHALKFKFQNALPRTAGNFLPEQTTPANAESVESSERLSHNNNYFLGNDKSKWAPNCGNFQRAALKDVWEGVDVVWRISASSTPPACGGGTKGGCLSPRPPKHTPPSPPPQAVGRVGLTPPQAVGEWAAALSSSTSSSTPARIRAKSEWNASA